MPHSMALTLTLLFSVPVMVTSTRVECLTTKGLFEIEVLPEWAPLGAQRYLDLVTDGFYTDIPMYRSVAGFLTQFGITESPEHKHWHGEQILDDPSLNKGIKKYFVSFAGGGENTRSTQIFIAYKDLDFLGKAPWETPFGRVVSGGEAVDSFHTGYGDIPPYGKGKWSTAHHTSLYAAGLLVHHVMKFRAGPDQQVLYKKGNSYIRDEFPLTDFIVRCAIKTEREVDL